MSDGMMFEFRPIGWLRSCFEEKFGTPRQPGLCPSAWAELRIEDDCGQRESWRALEGFSHVWVMFVFHQTIAKGWHPTVRPPRLGGNERVGVFASRSNFRPNGIGLSLCVLERLVWREGSVVLHLGGVDMLDGTPVLDVKPFLPYADDLQVARAGYAEEAPQRKTVVILPAAQASFAKLDERSQRVVIEALGLDPRPAAHADPAREYGVRMCGSEMRFRVDDVVTVVAVENGEN